MIIWARRICTWLGRGVVFWLGPFVITVALLVAFLFATSEAILRLAGLILQLLGTLTILLGLEKTRSVFGLPSLGASSAAWLRTFPKLREHRVGSLSADLAGSATLSARATVSQRAPEGASLEQRVRVIESNVQSLELRAEELQTQLDKSNLARTKALDAERRQRETEIALLSRKIEATQAEGIDTSLWGLIWLTLGLLLSTASQEIAHLALMIAA